jgi:hypothetical protein
MPRVSGVAALLLCAIAAGGGAAHAQRQDDLAAAEGLFAQGSALVNAGRYDEGCPKLERAQAIVMGIGVTLYVGECYEHRGEHLRAWRQFMKAEELASARGDRRQRVAHERAQRVWPALAKLRIVVPAGTRVAGLAVTDDGDDVPPAAWTGERPVEPRVHRVRASAPDREPWEVAIDVPAGGATVTVEVPPLRAGTAQLEGTAAGVVPTSAAATPSPSPAIATMPASPTAPSPTATLPSRRVAALVLLGAGALGVGVGAAFGLDAKSKLDDSNASGHCQPNDHCDSQGLAERSDALTSATISTIAFIGGAALVTGGVVLFLTSPGREPLVSVVARPERAGATFTLQRHW